MKPHETTFVFKLDSLIYDFHDSLIISRKIRVHLWRVRVFIINILIIESMFDSQPAPCGSPFETRRYAVHLCIVHRILIRSPGWNSQWHKAECVANKRPKSLTTIRAQNGRVYFNVSAIQANDCSYTSTRVHQLH